MKRKDGRDQQWSNIFRCSLLSCSPLYTCGSNFVSYILSKTADSTLPEEVNLDILFMPLVSIDLKSLRSILTGIADSLKRDRKPNILGGSLEIVNFSRSTVYHPFHNDY